VIGGFIQDKTGSPSHIGVLIHALVFVLLLQYAAKMV
jgi:hypothetical protein